MRHVQALSCPQGPEATLPDPLTRAPATGEATAACPNWDPGTEAVLPTVQGLTQARSPHGAGAHSLPMVSLAVFQAEFQRLALSQLLIFIKAADSCQQLPQALYPDSPRTAQADTPAQPREGLVLPGTVPKLPLGVPGRADRPGCQLWGQRAGSVPWWDQS